MSAAPPAYSDEFVTVIEGDCLDVMAGMEPNSVDTVITDPPYGLEFMGKEWDRISDQPGYKERGRITNRPTGASPFVGAGGRGVNSYQAGTPMQEWHTAWASAALRVAKPGAFLLAFGGTRTHHRLACALEDAGWEIRDTLCWLYGSGFPKSLDISKAIDKAAGAERVITRRHIQSSTRPDDHAGASAHITMPNSWNITAPATDAACAWSGWGTALKPAYEPIIVAMKPLDGTFAANAQKWGVAGLNIDAARIAADGEIVERVEEFTARTDAHDGYVRPGASKFTHKPVQRSGPAQAAGRWPANVALDESAAQALDEMSGELHSQDPVSRNSGRKPGWSPSGTDRPLLYKTNPNGGDSGGASRFFYTAKASRSEREGPDGEPNGHPTVKSLALMEWLCKLTSTPTGGVILDPFMGSGTTLLAARNVGRRCIGIEREPEYVQIACGRLKTWQPALFDAPESAPAPEPEDPEWQQPSLAL